MGQTQQMATGQAQAAAGRHIALSIVLDGRLAVPELAGIARLAARLGFGVWWRQPPLAGSAGASAEAVIGALMAAMPGAAPADAPDGSGGSGEAGEPDRGDAPSRTGGVDGPSLPPMQVGLIVEVGPAGGPVLASSASDAYARGARLALAGETGPVADLLRAQPGGCGPRVAVGHRVHGLHQRRVASCAVFVAASPARDVAAEVAAAVAACDGGAVLVEVPVSIGRTSAEAQARAADEAAFGATGHPAEQGLFGTLEQCQYRAAAFAHAGVTELVCHPPASRDLPDVLAQLRAVTAVGSHVLRPDEPPSPAPPPPVGWGGRRRGR